MRTAEPSRAVLASSAILILVVAATTVPLRAADQWVEVTSPHFRVLSNAGEGAGRDVAWQLEQLRSVIATAYPWVHLDLDRPLTIIAVKDQASMRALAPQYWEETGGLPPVGVWGDTADHYYMALRTDVRFEGRQFVNPYMTAYFSYVSLLLRSGLERPLPSWFMRGLAGVWSNTIVRPGDVVVGAPIPFYLRLIRERVRLPLSRVVSPTTDEARKSSELPQYDAQAWAFVHFLMFDNNGARRASLNAFVKKIASGTSPDDAFKETIGTPEALEEPLLTYVSRHILGMGLLKADARVKKEGFTTRVLPPAEQAGTRAAFHTMMHRPVEARAALTEARKADASFAAIDVVEAMLLDQENKPDEARAALARAIEHGSKNPYAHYRLARLMWKQDADSETLAAIDKTLTAAIGLDNKYAAAYAMLAEVRSTLKPALEHLGLARRAIALEPAESRYHLQTARVLWRIKQIDEARKEATTALALAITDQERAQAQEMLDALAKTAPSTSSLPLAPR